VSGSDAEADEDAMDVDEAPAKKTRGKKGKKEEETKGKAAGRKRKPKGGEEDEEDEEAIPEMPKTDKQLRHEKRIKEQERRERKKNKRAKIGAGNDGNGTCPATHQGSVTRLGQWPITPLFPWMGSRSVMEIVSLVRVFRIPEILFLSCLLSWCQTGSTRTVRWRR
jgi:hypothetical protein